MFGYVSWQDILRELKQLVLTNAYPQVIIKDLVNLLTRKGFEDFTSMSVETPAPINEHGYLSFDLKSRTDISFQTPLTISEGLYYEFSR